MGLGGGWRLAPAWTVGLLVSTYSVAFDQVDAAGASTGASLSQRSTSAGVAGGWKSGLFGAGATVKMVSDSVGPSSASTVAADLGAAVEWEGLTAGASYRNLGGALGTPVATGGAADALPGEIRGGAAYRYADWKLTGGIEYVKPSEGPGRAGLGVEWWPAAVLGLRAGMAGVSATQRQVTFGLTAAWNGAALDYALGAHPLGPVHRVSISYAFGAGTSVEAAPEPVSAATPDRGPQHAKAPARHRVVVAPFEHANVEAGDAATIANLLRKAITKQGGLGVVNEAATNAAALKGGAGACGDEDCAVNLGKALKADRVVIGHMEKLMSRHFINVRVVNVKSGEVIATEVAKGDTVDDLEKSINTLAARLAKKLP